MSNIKDSLGLENIGTIFRNSDVDFLIDFAVKNEKAKISSTGALMIDTGILYYFMIWCTTICPYLSYFSLFRHFPRFCAHLLQMKHQRFRKNIPENENFSRRFLSYHSIFQI